MVAPSKGKRHFADVIKDFRTRSSRITPVSPKSNDRCLHKKRQRPKEEGKTHTARPCAEGNRVWSDVATSKEHLRPPEDGRVRMGSPLERSEGACSCEHLDFRLLVSRVLRKEISVTVATLGN